MILPLTQVQKEKGRPYNGLGDFVDQARIFVRTIRSSSSIYGGFIFISLLPPLFSTMFMSLFVLAILKVPFDIFGALSSISSILLILTSLVGGILSDKYGERTMITALLLISTVWMTLYVLANSLVYFVAISIVVGFYNLGFPAIDSYISRLVSEEQLGLSFSFREIASLLVLGPSSLIAGFLWDMNPRTPFLLDMILSMCMIAVSLRIINQKSKHV